MEHYDNEGFAHDDGGRVYAREQSARYVRDYLRIFRDGGRFSIPEDRLVFRPGTPEAGSTLMTHTPGETMVIIKLIHGGYVSALYLGDWEAWTRGAMRFRQFYGGTVVTSDNVGPYRLPHLVRGRYLDLVARLLDIDADRPVVWEDIQDLVQPGQERMSKAESHSEILVDAGSGGGKMPIMPQMPQ